MTWPVQTFRLAAIRQVKFCWGLHSARAWALPTCSYAWARLGWRYNYFAGEKRIAVRGAGHLDASQNGLFFLLSNHLNSTAITMDQNGVKLAELRYMPWGETRYTSGSTPTDRRYTGQRELAELGLYHYGARFYDPYLSRWISPDSIVPDPKNKIDFDRYTYTRNNPVKYIDPTGHFPDILLDFAFITYDIIQIRNEGWTPVNTVALCADIAAAIVPMGTGAGPATRAIMAGGDAALAFTQAAVKLPTVLKVGQGGEKLVQAVEGSSTSPFSYSSSSSFSCPNCDISNPQLLRSRSAIANKQHIHELENVGKHGISAWCQGCYNGTGKFWGRTADEIRAFAEKTGLDPNKAVVYTPQFGGSGHYSLFTDAFGTNGYLLPDYAEQIEIFLRG